MADSKNTQTPPHTTTTHCLSAREPTIVPNTMADAKNTQTPPHKTTTHCLSAREPTMVPNTIEEPKPAMNRRPMSFTVNP